MKQVILLFCLTGIMYFSFAQTWLTTGNSGLTSVNFLGTTDAQALRFKTNNQVSGIIDFSSANANTAFGFQTLKVNTGNNNVAFGYKAMVFNTSGRLNTASGAYALYNNTTGYSNVGTGIAALFANKKLNNLVGIGDSALYNNNTGPGQNTAVGSKALYGNTGGYYNTALGYQAIYTNSSGYANTGIGYKALYSNTSGESNTAVGSNALYHSTFGFNNTAVGNFALQFDSGGYINTAVGTQALYLNGEGDYNSALGHQALGSNNTGSKNTAVGVFAIYGNTTGNNNTALGYSTNVNSGVYSNFTALGYLAAITASDQVRIGNSAVTSIGGYANWSNISDGRVKKNIRQNVPGLSFINRLIPVTYNMDLDAADQIVQMPAIKDKTSEAKGIKTFSVEDGQARKQKEQILYTGFVAQQVEKAAKELGYDFSGVDVAKNEKDLYGLRYAEFVVPLVKAVQELSAANDVKDAALAAQQKVNADLQKQIDELKKVAGIQTSALSSQSSGNNQQVELSSVEAATLYQNQPNPFKQATVIKYHLPALSNAQMLIADAKGNTLKTISLGAKGDGQVTLAAGVLAQGTYFYSLIVEGKKVDTRQMQIVK